ncbi:MAG: glycosyltransferase [Candidatus Shapirobacteria bacterium]|jgi:glycosyltransferase involved in cell wall biosynthesis
MTIPIFSIIIPVKVPTQYLKETLKKLKKQSFKSFEILVITDKISKSSNPSVKRNLGAKMAKGKYLAFLDDDSYPSRNWLKNAKIVLDKKSTAAAACGPCLTPPKDTVGQLASGLFWSSCLGSGGAGNYRSSVQASRSVDDFPSVNLIVKKKDFDKIGGFSTKDWPGEDTVLCLDLTKKLNKQIIYNPKIVVYHHRRTILKPHLQQIGRYAKMRGSFVKKYPATSARLGYFLPSLFFLYLISLPIHRFLFPLYLYLLALFITFLIFIKNKSNPTASFLAIIITPITHLYYGILFLVGLFQNEK